jgi:hypothetical protein
MQLFGNFVHKIGSNSKMVDFGIFEVFPPFFFELCHISGHDSSSECMGGGASVQWETAADALSALLL